MKNKPSMKDYPKRLRMGQDGAAVFERDPDLYAVHEGPSSDAAPTRNRPDTGASKTRRSAADATPVTIVRDGATSAFAVYRGQPDRRRLDSEVGPVYSAGPDGPLAVPTGRVLVRLAKGMKPEERTHEFASAGYEIEKTLSYAPSAAWLRPRAGGIAQALNNLDALERTPGVEHVEPQLLMERAFKS